MSSTMIPPRPSTGTTQRLPRYAQSTLSQRLKSNHPQHSLDSSSSTGRKRNINPDDNPIKHPQKTRIITSNIRYQSSDIIHDTDACMFKIKLDSQGRIAALCYLPTRLHLLVDFYHTEIPENYRHLGLGDLLARYAFEWAEENNKLVIPTCAFIQRYLEHYKYMNNVVRNEQEAIERLAIMKLRQQPPPSPVSSSPVPSSITTLATSSSKPL
ncbi:hypothetical protein K492DRAFT_237317 [Lichtheimia hyalospora FSU 10163]|nr:hypothetical protein K492DRAFT_237317 [Lichtheimia hyalospora FSU 10163]